jgi:hypothetical protein
MTLVLRSSASKNYELLPQAGIQARSNDAFGPSSVLPPGWCQTLGGVRAGFGRAALARARLLSNTGRAAEALGWRPVCRRVRKRRSTA